MTDNAKNSTARNTIQDPPEYNAESAKNLAAQKDQSPTFDQLGADLQGLITQFRVCIAEPAIYGPKFTRAAPILETFCSPNENDEPMTASDAYQAISYQLSH
ncbi:hypothetical protein AB4Y89_08150 [Terriglobus sp. 2YAB30_2]|uniref:hypothetical protein n=1 Tax=unclassified Terriglobus TaxID=2628988 RepID=UPI003F9A958B